MPPKKSPPYLIMGLVALIVIAFSVGGIALATNGKFFSSSKPASSTPAPTAPTTPAETPPSTPPEEPTPPPAPALPAAQAPAITAKELISAFSTDIVGASSQHQGKTYAISGIVSGVSSSAPPYLYINDGTPEKVEIQCAFSQGQEAKIAELELGKPVKVEGRIINFQNSIIVVSDCRLVQ